MPLKFFICPDQTTIGLQECLKECRLKKRCLTKPTLMKLSEVREWKGIPSVTQLLNGTYQSFLRITKDYAENPDKMAYRLLGTTVHAGLEQVEDETLMVESSNVGSDGISGTSDLVETEGDWNILTDYKTSGSYKVAKALGAYQRCRDSDTEVYKQKTVTTVDGMKITRLKGEPKVIKEWAFDIGKQDCKDWILQLNKYRLDFEEQGVRIDEMRIQAIIRDGGTINAKNNGLDKNIYLIPIPHMDDSEVRSYFEKKKSDLMIALDVGDWDTKCNEEETWNGIKCERFCEVSEFCKFMENEDE